MCVYYTLCICICIVWEGRTRVRWRGGKSDNVTASRLPPIFRLTHGCAQDFIHMYIYIYKVRYISYILYIWNVSHIQYSEVNAGWRWLGWTHHGLTYVLTNTSISNNTGMCLNTNILACTAVPSPLIPLACVCFYKFLPNLPVSYFSDDLNIAFKTKHDCLFVLFLPLNKQA